MNTFLKAIAANMFIVLDMSSTYYFIYDYCYHKTKFEENQYYHFIIKYYAVNDIRTCKFGRKTMIYIHLSFEF